MIDSSLPAVSDASERNEEAERHSRHARTMVTFSVALVLLLLVVLTVGTAVAEATLSFSDVPTSAGEHEAVEFLSKAGVISGYPNGTFQPRDPVTRGQSAKMLVTQQGIVVPPSGSWSFTDLDSLYRPYVTAAAGAGWISGYPDGTFRPYSPLLRQHMAVVVVRCLGWEKDAQALSGSQVSAILSRFGDRAEIAGGARPYVALAVERGLMRGGADGRFMPTDTTVRAHFSMVAYRAALRSAAVLDGVRYSADHLDKTRIVLDLSAKPAGLETSLDGRVLRIDIGGAIVPGGLEALQFDSPEADGVAVRQTGYRSPGVEAAITLDSYTDYDVFAIPPSDGMGHRVVVDVFRKVETDGKPLVAIDPGHGGSDPGATGVTGVKEKDVNLSIGLLVDGYLRQAGLVTLMTRQDDSYPTLEERVDMANAAEADVFVSIHNNAAGDSGISGTETFYWGTPDEYSVEGLRLATAIQEELLAELGSNDRGARTHWKSLYVLGHAEMPAVLTEVGFLTNEEEEAKLTDPAYQDRAAKAIAKGVVAYFEWDYTFRD